MAWDYEDVLTKLKTYRYRDDIVLLDHIPDEQLKRITASAYALVYPSFFEGFGLPIIEAMQCEVPVVTSNTSSMPETGGDAALYADPSDPDAIAKHMMNLYKDESMRYAQIAAGGYRPKNSAGIEQRMRCGKIYCRLQDSKTLTDYGLADWRIISNSPIC